MMDNTYGNVTSLPVINIDADLTAGNSNSISKHSQDTIDFAKAVILGMAELVQTQRHFSEKFGLTLSQVFPNSYKALYNTRSKDFVSTLFESGSKNVNEIKDLFDDLISHQVALRNSLDGIADEGLEQLSPATIQFSDNKRVKDAHAWRIFQVYHEELKINANMRFDKIISKGLIDKYRVSKKGKVKNIHR